MDIDIGNSQTCVSMVSPWQWINHPPRGAGGSLPPSLQYFFFSSWAKTSFLMALRALTTFFHEALGSDWSQAFMAARRRALPCLVSSIFKRSGYSVPSWTPKVIVSDQVRSYSSRDRSGSFGLASDIPPSPSPSPSLPLFLFLSSYTFASTDLSTAPFSALQI